VQQEARSPAHRPIHQLSASLVNRIAAGEVIERPASVVKELVENALDAGSSQIIVEIEDGGRELIRVIDDGCGIPAGELPLAFAEHATSKLSSDEDLFRIATMGFRGEALASIGAVSQARLLSRSAGTESAYEIFDRGGQISAPQAAAGNAGTTVEVRNLFYNTPARRKFMKGSATEFGHISEAMLRLALPHPTVGFKLLHNGRTALDLPAGSEAERLLAAWPKEFADQRIVIDVRDAELRLTGMVGLPELARPTAKYQFFYLNGRHIRDKFIQHATREAYRGLTEPGRYPACVLKLQMPPGDVDVNVHPTKVEVRFRDSGRIHGLVLSAIREQLLASDLTPAAVPLQADDPMHRAAREDMRAKLAALFKGEDVAPPVEYAPTFELQRQAGPPPRLEFDAVAKTQPSGQNARTSEAESPKPQAAPAPPAAAIQLHNSYLVAQTDDGMIIIDQHALHERVMYEELRARLLRGPLESQRLLIPATLGASSRQVALLDQIQPLLARLGIEVGPFGPCTLAVQAFPTFLSKLDPATFVRELLERGEQELLDLHEEEILHELLDMMACKAAVKAGDPLTAAEIQALLERRELVDRSSNCPHGRPTTLRLTLSELEKQFKRTGF
jgi:DNA mismatch repair protein MutL